MTKDRGNYLPAPHLFNLNMACLVLSEAFGHCIYQVGSSLERETYRDVDVRVILADGDFDYLFRPRTTNMSLDSLWSILCASIALYLSQHSGLPVDFQIQRMTEANAKYPDGKRHPLGIMLNGRPFDRYASGGDASPVPVRTIT